MALGSAFAQGWNLSGCRAFAIGRAGTKLTLEFEVAYALYPDARKPLLRSVFIGVRWVFKDGDLK